MSSGRQGTRPRNSFLRWTRVCFRHGCKGSHGSALELPRRIITVYYGDANRIAGCCERPEYRQQMRPLRVLHSESSKGWGGQEHRTLKEMIALRELGHTVGIVCPSDARIGTRSTEEGFYVHHARMRGGGDLRSMFLLKALLAQRKFDVVNTHSGHDTLVAGAAARLVGTPLIVRTRHLALPISSLATYTWIPHRVIAVSRFVRQYLISAGVPEQRVETIYDGIVKPNVQLHSTLRTELGIDANAIVAATVAIMRDKKGHEDLIAAAQPMLTERPNLHFVMAGDGPWFEKIKSIVEGLGLQHRIHLLGFRQQPRAREVARWVNRRERRRL